MTREEADKLLEDLIVYTEWAASESEEWRMYHKRACSLREQIIDTLCAPDAAVEALKEVEWVTQYGTGGSMCPWCKGYYPDHQADCARQAAIAAAEEG